MVLVSQAVSYPNLGNNLVDSPADGLVTLWDMLSKYARAFAQLTTTLADLDRVLKIRSEEAEKVEFGTGWWVDVLTALKFELAVVEANSQLIGLDSAAAHVERIADELRRGCTILDLRSMLFELRNRVLDQLQQRHFLFVRDAN